MNNYEPQSRSRRTGDHFDEKLFEVPITLFGQQS